ncbi:MAG: hypothetical protein NC420_11785 [Eubacterium sp.]|nr:hypothetical protein [Eubacterium sp.]
MEGIYRAIRGLPELSGRSQPKDRNASHALSVWGRNIRSRGCGRGSQYGRKGRWTDRTGLQVSEKPDPASRKRRVRQHQERNHPRKNTGTRTGK